VKAVDSQLEQGGTDHLSGKRRPLRFLPLLLVVLVVALLMFLDSARTSAADPGQPRYDLDASGQAVWLDSSIRLVVDKPLSLWEVEAAFTIEPRPADCPSCLVVSRAGLASWDGWAPWAETTVVFNPDRRSIFEPDAVYTLSVLGKRFQFRTIPVPKAVGSSPSPGTGRVHTTARIEVEFDRPLGENPPDLVSIEPATPFVVRSRDNKLILAHDRLQTDTLYRVSVNPGVRDQERHPSQETFVFAFVTVPPPTVVRTEPPGSKAQSVFGERRLVFDRPMERSSVERSFAVEPPASGDLEWMDDRTLVWKPLALFYDTTYRISVRGMSRTGDAMQEPYTWAFSTRESPPPVITSSADGGLVLTFDDQGTAEQVKAILDILAAEQVKAVFFPVGKWAQLNPELIQGMEDEGHLVGNHTYSHADLTKLTEEEVRREIEDGPGSHFLRLPYGKHNAIVDNVAEELGYQIYGWNVDPQDWNGASAQQIVETAVREVQSGSVIVLHMQGKHTAEALEQLIPLLREMGYTFSIPEPPSS
jgi:hypothetical protein